MGITNSIKVLSAIATLLLAACSGGTEETTPSQE